MMMENFLRKKMPEVRSALGQAEVRDDREAMERIVELVFADPDAAALSMEEIDLAIQRLFLQTRSRLGILQPLMRDGGVTEIMVNGPAHVFIERDGQMEAYPLRFDTVESLEEVMRGIAAQVHRQIDEMHPIVDARLADGSRVNGVYKNVAVNGPILTIRKFSERFMTMEALVRGGTLDPVGAELLSILVACGYNLFVSGGTSSGKTTLLNALADAIPRGERVIIIEDSSELKLRGVENIVHLECRSSNSQGQGQVDMSQLIRSSLRMRPDRIIVGEVRGGEVLDMLQAMNTGHAGSMSTGHGNSVEGMLRRLETMYMMAAPMHVDAIRAQIAEALDLMVHVEKGGDGKRRVAEIVEIVGYEDGRFKLNPLMERAGGCLKATGHRLVQTKKVEGKDGRYADRLRALGFLG